MRRREFIKLVGGATVASPRYSYVRSRVSASGASACSCRNASDNRQGQAHVAGFLQMLKEAGWIVGRNVQIDYRWTAGKIDNARKFATELAALAPDIIFAAGGPNVAALQQATRMIPVVFV